MMAIEEQLSAGDIELRHRLKDIALAGASNEAAAASAMLGALADVLLRRFSVEEAVGLICSSVIEAGQLVAPPAGHA